MAFVEVGPASALPPETVMEVTLGDRLFAVCNIGGTLHAVDGVCPHTGGPLGQGNVQDGRLVCPYHMWEFDCATGESDRDPRCRLETFAVKVEDGRIWLKAT